jgi:glyoxylase-like metal-dependent hydrolase (beta-lactamase superfamily II)
MSAARPEVRAFFHKPTWTLTYVVADPVARRAAVIDPALDFDPASGRTGTHSADEVSAFIRERGWTLDWILETHAHADHLSAAQHLRRTLGGRVAIGEGITKVQRTFVEVFGIAGSVATDGSQFDHLFRDGERFQVGGIAAEVIHTPGHTNDSVTYLIGDAAFVGDTMFMPDGGTARCDFPGGDARLLYRSLQRILALPADTRLFMCHDYQPGGRELRFETTIGAQRAENVHLKGGASEQDFVEMREARDATLGMPNLIVQSIQVNIRAGHLPEPDANGVRYLKTPLDVLGRPLAAPKAGG